MNVRLLAATGLFAAGLIAIGEWRRLSLSVGEATAMEGGPTLAFIGWAVAFVLLLPRCGARFGRLGFREPFSPARHLGLAAAGVFLIQLWAATLEPLLANRFGSQRDLAPFETGDLAELLPLIAFSWVFAAFGEEITFRIVLLRSLTIAFGDSRTATFAALPLQAIVFALVHLYQGPVGVFGTGLSGLVFGALVLAARGSIWPAALAHGTSNSISLLLLYAAS